jgi:hypothetical protein
MHKIRSRVLFRNSLSTRWILTICALLLLSFSSFGQFNPYAKQKKKRNQVPSYFGLQAKPIIPVRIFGAGPVTLTNDMLEATVTPLWGYSFGGVVRAGISKRFAIETGLNIVQRNYRTDYFVPDSNFTAETTLGVVSYDVPLNALVYIQLSKQWFMNTSMGVSGNFYPSNVRKDDNGYPHMFMTEGRRKSWVRLAFNANVGFEWRTNKAGFFYLGGSFQLPFGGIFDIAPAYKYKNINYPIFGEMNGTYVTVDFKYFLPVIERKGKQFQDGPVEQ